VDKLSKAKVNLSCCLHAGAKGERSYCCYSFLASALDGVSGQRHAPAMLYPQGKDPRYPLDRRLGGEASELVWAQRLDEESYASAEDRTPVVQSVARYYTLLGRVEKQA
jgi:hypothetical protein